MRKPKVGFMALCAPVHVEVIDDLGRSFPATGAAEMACRTLENQAFDVVRYPFEPLITGEVKEYQVKDFNRNALIDSKQKCEAAFDRFVAEGVDCVVMFFTTWMWMSHYTQSILKQEAATHNLVFPRQEGCQMVGLLGMHGTLDELGVEHEMIYGMHDDDAALGKISRYTKACAVKNVLSHSKYGRFGGRCMDMIPGLFDNNDWILKFGVEVEELGQEILTKQGEKFSRDEINDVYRRIQSQFSNVPAIDDQYIEKNIRFYLAHKKVTVEHGLDFTGIKCVFELSDYYGKPCIAQSLMLEDGFVTTCCCEDKGALTQYIMSMLSDAAQFQGDVEHVDVKTGKIHMASCGAAAPSLSCESCKAKLTGGAPIEGELGGYSVTITAKKSPVTLARLARVNGEYVMLIAQGQMFASTHEENMECGFDSFPHLNIQLQGDPEVFLQNLRSQYMHFACDSIQDELVSACRMLGVRPILI